jgi:hypothetical protein
VVLRRGHAGRGAAARATRRLLLPRHLRNRARLGRGSTTARLGVGLAILALTVTVAVTGTVGAAGAAGLAAIGILSADLPDRRPSKA